MLVHVMTGYIMLCQARSILVRICQVRSG